MSSDPKPIGLAEAIRQVRTELEEARRGGEGRELQFRLDEVTLDFQVEVKREGGGEAGIKLYVVSVGAKGGASNVQTHTVTVSLVPQTKVNGQWVDVRVGQDVTERPPASGPGQPPASGSGR